MPNTADDVVERVAAALAQHHHDQSPLTGDCDREPLHWKLFEGEARAAIAAMPSSVGDAERFRVLLIEGVKPMATAERFDWGQRVRDALSTVSETKDEGFFAENAKKSASSPQSAPQVGDEKLCMGCEDKPAPENNPCAVCGASSPQSAPQVGESICIEHDGKLICLPPEDWHKAIASLNRAPTLEDVERRARELLARSYEADDCAAFADQLRAGELDPPDYVAFRAIQEALTNTAPLVEALEPFALLAGGDVNMNDPLKKWFTVAQLQEAAQALSQYNGKGDRI